MKESRYKGYTHWDSIYRTFWQRQNYMDKSSLVVARGCRWEKGRIAKKLGFGLGDGTLLYRDCASGYVTL